MADELESVKFLMELAAHTGAACGPTKDGGHIIVFQRSYLQNLLDKTAGKEQIMMLIKNNPSTNQGD